MKDIKPSRLGFIFANNARVIKKKAQGKPKLRSCLREKKKALGYPTYGGSLQDWGKLKKYLAYGKSAGL